MPHPVFKWTPKKALTGFEHFDEPQRPALRGLSLLGQVHVVGVPSSQGLKEPLDLRGHREVT